MNRRIPKAVIERDPNWKLSVGEAITKIHWRNGKMHATCDPNDSICMIHKDSHDPHQFPVGTAKHLWDWSPPVAVGLGLAGLYLAYKIIWGRSN